MDQNKDSRQISQGRKNLYYLGIALMVLGFIAFSSVFVNGFLAMNDPFPWGSGGPGFMVWGLVGFVLILAGALLRGIGARGLAGSGLKLDPQQAREELQPYTDALGGMARDAADSFKQAGGDKEDKARVMVRCRACRALNDEADKFCGQCGQEL